MLDRRKVDRSTYRIVTEQPVLDEALKRCRFETRGTIDISAFSDEALSTAVRPHLAADALYLVWWAHDRAAVSMYGAAISAQIGALWYPSSDDVVIYDEAMRPIMLIDHEELLCLP